MRRWAASLVWPAVLLWACLALHTAAERESLHLSDPVGILPLHQACVRHAWSGRRRVLCSEGGWHPGAVGESAGPLVFAPSTREHASYLHRLFGCSAPLLGAEALGQAAGARACVPAANRRQRYCCCRCCHAPCPCVHSMFTLTSADEQQDEKLIGWRGETYKKGVSRTVERERPRAAAVRQLPSIRPGCRLLPEPPMLHKLRAQSLGCVCARVYMCTPLLCMLCARRAPRGRGPQVERRRSRLGPGRAPPVPPSASGRPHPCSTQAALALHPQGPAHLALLGTAHPQDWLLRTRSSMIAATGASPACLPGCLPSGSRRYLGTPVRSSTTASLAMRSVTTSPTWWRAGWVWRRRWWWCVGGRMLSGRQVGRGGGGICG